MRGQHMADDDFNDDDMLENAIQATEEIIYGAEINRRTPCRHTLHRVQLKRFMKKYNFSRTPLYCFIKFSFLINRFLCINPAVFQIKFY